MEILLIRPFQLWPIFYYESFRQPQEKRRHLLITEMVSIRLPSNIVPIGGIGEDALHLAIDNMKAFLKII
ncbi:Dual oxidase 1 [Bienertia sinuspersici]